MFNKLKQLKDLRSQAKQMQSALGAETIEIEKNGIQIKINGNLEITYLKLPANNDKENLEKNLKDALNDLIKKAQKVMAEKMRSMGGLDNLKNLLG